jgi:hypothetical protein
VAQADLVRPATALSLRLPVIDDGMSPSGSSALVGDARMQGTSVVMPRLAFVVAGKPSCEGVQRDFSDSAVAPTNTVPAY